MVESIAEARPPVRHLWGLSVTALHDRFWASRGIQVVRQGQPAEIVDRAELYMLVESNLLTVFSPRRAVEDIFWAGASATLVRIHEERQREYSEKVVLDDAGRFVTIARMYGATERRLTRVALTTNRDLAAMWQRTRDPAQAWRDLRRRVPRLRRWVTSLNGMVYQSDVPVEQAEFVRKLLASWSTPSASIPLVDQRGPSFWTHHSAVVDPGTSASGPVWVGAGRTCGQDRQLVGPAVLWDEPGSATITDMDWRSLEPTQWIKGSARTRPRAHRIIKRTFDLCFALCALLGTLWIFPLAMLAIAIEDGRPFFFGHERETQGGRRFKCWKFRSMRKDAEKIKAQLAAQNQADGPQFFMENDPRLTRVGRFIRKFHIDELPQFYNVLVGEMSVVGPRPSPYAENQFNPAWREARLSMLPGMTGLWQVRRTRQKGTDFQEWIRYDIEYAETANLGLDAWIILETVKQIFGLGRSN
jgi:lipopolysaccharide/colanic/teichoic acid biosynthesis glycosyltransferase